MNYTCGDNKPDVQSNNYFYACENASAAISCQAGQFISSGSFKYGRWDNSVCPGAGVNISTAAKFQTYNLPPTCLQGSTTCFLDKSPYFKLLFGDPYPGVYKHVSTLRINKI